MDSLDAVEVVMAFEDEFGKAQPQLMNFVLDVIIVLTGCEITDEEAEKIFSAKDAIELLKTKLDVH